MSRPLHTSSYLSALLLLGALGVVNAATCQNLQPSPSKLGTGEPYSIMRRKSVAECCPICQQDARCMSFTHWHDGGGEIGRCSFYDNAEIADGRLGEWAQSYAVDATPKLPSRPFTVVANDTMTINLDSGCLAIQTSEKAPDSDDDGNSGSSGRRLLNEHSGRRMGDVKTIFRKKKHGVLNNAVVLAAQPSCPVFKTIATHVENEFLLTADGGNECVGLTQYANPARYMMPKRKDNIETELVPLTLVPCSNMGCMRSNVGCPVPFSFKGCKASLSNGRYIFAGCDQISVKGGLPYNNGGRLRTDTSATSLMVQPIRVADPYEGGVTWQVQPNNTQVFIGQNVTSQDWIIDRMTYLAYQTWSTQCVTCKLTDGGIFTSGYWELVPGGTNPMGATQTLTVSHGVTDQRGSSQTRTVSHQHSVSLAISDSITTGFSMFGFSISNTFTTTHTTTNTVTHTLSNEVSQSQSVSTSSTFSQACPSSSEPYLKQNPGYMKGVAMWQWVIRSEYNNEEQSCRPWATYWSHHIVCTYGNNPSTYGPKPQCPPTYCEAGAAENCQKCSSYDWQPNSTQSTQDGTAAGVSNDAQGTLAGRLSDSKKDSADSDSDASDSSRSAGSSSSNASSGSSYTLIAIVVTVACVGLGVVAFVVYRMRVVKSARMPQNLELQANLVEGGETYDYRGAQGRECEGH